MSEAVLHQVKTLINDLSTPEKAQLVEWLGEALVSELLTIMPKAAKEASAAYITVADQDPAVVPANNGEVHHTMPEQDEIPWEERPWTEAEIRELMKPEPKTGAEIAALIDQLDLSEWQAMDIPDVVEWLKEQRHQEAVRRGVYSDEEQ